MVTIDEPKFPASAEDSMGHTLEAQSIAAAARKEVTNALTEKLLSEKQIKNDLVEYSQIDAPRTFNEKEIVGVILETLTEEQKPNAEKLKIARIVRDEKGIIVELNAILPDIDEKTGFTEINYQIQGKYGSLKKLSNPGGDAITTIKHYRCDSDGIPMSGDTIVVFKDGKWVPPSNQGETKITKPNL